jgi:hypothetical protein
VKVSILSIPDSIFFQLAEVIATITTSYSVQTLMSLLKVSSSIELSFSSNNVEITSSVSVLSILFVILNSLVASCALSRRFVKVSLTLLYATTAIQSNTKSSDFVSVVTVFVAVFVTVLFNATSFEYTLSSQFSSIDVTTKE